MKFLTKEWLIADSLSRLCNGMRPARRAEEKDENFYIACRNSALHRFLQAEYGDAPYEMSALHRFEKHARTNEEICKHLPARILNKIADLRVFALGYASEQVIELLRPYCAEQKNLSENLKQRALQATEEAAKYLSKKIELHRCVDLGVQSVEAKGKDLWLKFILGPTLIVIDYEITENELPEIFSLNGPAGENGFCAAVAIELQRCGKAFELQLLAVCQNELYESRAGALSIRGADLLMINEGAEE